MGIQAAVAAGYGVREILNFLSRTNPQFSRSINQALAGGYTADQIVKFLEKHENIGKPQRYNPNVGRNPLIEAAESVKTPLPEPVKSLGKAALGAAGAYALNRAIPSIANSALTSLGFANPQTTQQQNEPTQPPQPPNGNAVGVDESPTQKNESLDSKRVLDQMDVTSIVDAISHENPDIVTAVLEQKMLKPEQLKWLRKNRIDLRSIVSDYLGSKNTVAQPQQPSATQTAPAFTPISTPAIKSPEWPTVANPKFSGIPNEQKKLALLPSGDLGTVVGEKNGISQIDVDGVIKHRKNDEFILSPENEKEIGDLYEQLLSKIPESERSSRIDWAGYDPKVNEFAYRPHGAALYVYKNIPAEWVEKLKSSGFLAKTTGGNIYGAWAAGEASRNAGIVELIKELKEKAALHSINGVAPSSPHGKEYERKFETVYDFLSIPKRILQQRDKERQKAAAEEKRRAKKPKKEKKRSSTQ